MLSSQLLADILLCAQDPNAPNEETNELLARQFAILGACLSDAAPAVRAEATAGVCRLLDLYWEVVPAATSASFLKRLVGAALLWDVSGLRLWICPCFVRSCITACGAEMHAVRSQPTVSEDGLATQSKLALCCTGSLP